MYGPHPFLSGNTKDEVKYLSSPFNRSGRTLENIEFSAICRFYFDEMGQKYSWKEYTDCKEGAG